MNVTYIVIKTLMQQCFIEHVVEQRQVLFHNKLFSSMTGQVLVESMDLSAHRLSVKTSVEDESERADSTLSR